MLMKLTLREFNAMNKPLRRIFQRLVGKGES